MAESTKKASENHPENVKKTAPKNIKTNHQETQQKSSENNKKTRWKKETPKGLPGLTTYGKVRADRDPLLPQTPSSQRCLTAPERKALASAFRNLLPTTYYLLPE